jgi:hypothetical protein
MAGRQAGRQAGCNVDKALEKQRLLGCIGIHHFIDTEPLNACGCHTC